MFLAEEGNFTFRKQKNKKFIPSVYNNDDDRTTMNAVMPVELCPIIYE